MAVVGGSSLAAEWVLQGAIYFDDSASYDDLNPLYVLAYMVLLVPPPVVIGVVLWRGHVFGEPPGAGRKLSWPVLVTVIIVGVWWVGVLGSAGMMLLYTLMGW